MGVTPGWPAVGEARVCDLDQLRSRTLESNLALCFPHSRHACLVTRATVSPPALLIKACQYPGSAMSKAAGVDHTTAILCAYHDQQRTVEKMAAKLACSGMSSHAAHWDAELAISILRYRKHRG